MLGRESKPQEGRAMSQSAEKRKRKYSLKRWGDGLWEGKVEGTVMSTQTSRGKGGEGGKVTISSEEGRDLKERISSDEG